ncbi:cellulose synthase/poly-beta-1,6-N-acetylglucosamine synthase-like glycosyltransferase/peptidoglycan/xylan/chitin deacetylase (PgdA/CDA1 family) [Kitasatospora gansuensis]|uniref:Cellulose synthase/poly-beta-1,6-N-acetylglucosamine synthase-like glycosyltransferase/peptidoglycan/xylan/chitin deacetylase (PgdA/CDA1 family) n=1 Tax=Kitasatospora gansuensis TaxID=258050 RepID=A0A7W7WKR5_9ACTN|nr:bifunctional polysaccharide deacetylase/glycosyltransferase family 2 protein [Kitasatospora gansuensis]MBB4950473.1 cellulose synthase/poly-beta-1,6-N-acetylglucosamine synthase-like glycosyltransferase/peptidoglycan/xylan/chitin deacetylase (PgdA/CDA1 family) [Kitasatospora gansuensis]
MSKNRRRARGRRASVRNVPLRTHWLLLTTLVLTLSAALLLQGYTQHMFDGTADGAPRVAGPAEAVPAQIASGGPVIEGAAGRTAAPKARTIALTFDDGPDPVWTPQILDVLRRNEVRATFFAVGTQVAAHPDLARRIVADGHQIGLHTFTHTNLGTAPAWRRSLELRESQLAVAGATGVTTPLLRPPYSSTSNALSDADWSAVLAAGEDGYLTVLTTQDSEDWRRPGTAGIVANATPKDQAGQIVLLHDAGGDRSQTVAALEQLIPRLRAAGFTFGTVSEATGLPDPVQRASATDHWQGLALITALRTSDWVLAALSWLLWAAGGIALLRAVAVLVAARRHKKMRGKPWGRPVTEPVSVIVPAYNESAGIEAAVRSLLASDHPVEIIVVDDGSTDGTADLVEALRLPGVRVIRQQNAGKPAALNTGIAAASCQLLVMVDGDTVFEPDAVRMIVQPFANRRVGAVSGNAKVVNRGGLLGRWQHIEYVVGFNLDRRLFDLAECMPTVPGAVGAFRREALLRIGGVSDTTLAEDTDLTMALCRDGWRVVYEERAKAWTEAPASLGALWKQRYRWCYGTLQAMWKHRGALVQRGQAGKLGRRGLLYLLMFQVLLPLLAPVVDVFAVYGLVFLDPVRIIGLWGAFLLLQIFMGLYAFRLDKERPGALWSLPLQQFVYRQLMYLVVIQSVFTAVAGSRLRWQRMERYGSLTVPPKAGQGAAH